MHTSATINVSTPIRRTPRVQLVEAMFDLPPAEHSGQSWNVYLPLAERPWHVGLVVGPSGCGKSTLARHLWPEALAAAAFTWPPDASVLDAFPAGLAIKDLVGLLAAVGFSSPPAWRRPFHALSTGQQFRVRLARLLAEQPQLAVMDEFTSVVDRTVAQIGSAALARTVRQRGQHFIALTCHEDVEPWLTPDWIYRPDSNTFQWRSLQRRPPIPLAIRRVPRSLWSRFQPHHYLNHALAPAAVCFAAFYRDQAVAFSAWINFAGARRPTRREHRTVTLPDYQGVGIGHALSSHIAALWKALGLRATSTTTHPAFVARRLRDPNWRLRRGPGLARARPGNAFRHATRRLTVGFEYVGPPLPPETARALYGPYPARVL